MKIQRKPKKNHKNTKKVLENTEPCMCRVHLTLEAGKKDAIPCIGHGKGCPCTEKAIHDAEINSPEKANQVAENELKEKTVDGSSPTV